MSKDKEKNWKKFREENERVEEEQADMDEELAIDAMENHLEGALEHPSYAALEEKLTLAEQLAHENWEKAARAQSELSNALRRSEREVANAHKYGVEKLITSLLPVMDSLEQALQLAEKHADASMKEGLELTMKLFLDGLQKFDVVQIDPQEMPFDPQEHEAMSMLDAPGVAPNTVINVFQKGYKLSDRVIRPARVIVSKGKSTN